MGQHFSLLFIFSDSQKQNSDTQGNESKCFSHRYEPRILFSLLVVLFSAKIQAERIAKGAFYTSFFPQIVKELLMRNQTPEHTPGPLLGEAGSDSEAWVEDEEDLTEETRIKSEGIKMMARWLLGLKTDVISAQKTFRMLNAFVLHKGDLLETGKMM